MQIMRRELLILSVIFFITSAAVSAQNSGEGYVTITSAGAEKSSATIEPAIMAGVPGIAVVFEGTDDLHYYARKETAPAGLNLQIAASCPDIKFGRPVYPRWSYFHDIEVYVGRFEIFIPFESYDKNLSGAQVSVKIEGIACTSVLCLPPFEKTLAASPDLSKVNSWQQISFEVAETPPTTEQVVAGASYSTAVYLLLAVLAGLSFNIMPCVLPVIPLIVMRLVEQSKQKSSLRIRSGIAFCLGIVLFFAAFAAAAIIVKLTTGAVFNWSDQLRYPAFLTGMGLGLIVLGLFMFDVFSIPMLVSVSGKSGSGAGVSGALGMGFLAALLSTPCSGAILAGVLVWAQAQPVAVSTIAIILMGVGMAIPYAVLTAAPALLDKIPRPGTWMEIFKKSMGFVLIIIAVKLLGALPKERLVDVFYYGAVLSFCAWMWGNWVGYSTPKTSKYSIRITALLIAVVCGFLLLPQAEKSLQWKDYEPAVIQSAKQQGRGVVIKFTADWCTNCAFLEKRVFENADVAETIKRKNILPVKADTTIIDNQATLDLKNIYSEPGNVPVTIVISPAGQITKLRGIFDRDKLLEILNSF